METPRGNGSGRDPSALVLDPSDFRHIQDLALGHAGLRLPAEKLSVVRFRLGVRVRTLELASFSEYLQRVREDPRELARMIEALTNNNTSFFREPDHHRLLRAVLDGPLRTPREVRIWSAGCSTGEEPYTLAMLVRHWHDHAAGRVRILGTDVSRRALSVARAGRYKSEQVEAIPPALRDRFMEPTDQPGSFEVLSEVRQAVRLARLNLMDAWPMQRRFHLIFCRNVMIYFDRATQRRLAERFWHALEPGGYLFLGRTESLRLPADPFVFLEPSVYRKRTESS